MNRTERRDKCKGKQERSCNESFFIFGCPWSWKGFFLEKVKEDIGNYDIYSASSLIERYHPATDAGYKRVSNVNDNQNILIKAIREEKAHNTKDFILDGHLCILNKQGSVERIPESFFAGAQITGIVLLQDDPEMICERLRNRDSDGISIQIIEKMQNEEKIYARELQNKYHIRQAIISHECTGKQFADVLREIGGGTNE